MNPKPLSRSQKVAGLATIAAMPLAFVLDNSPVRDWYEVVHHLPGMVRVSTFAINKPLILWINDGLMGFVFLLIALELKREILEGLRSGCSEICESQAIQGGAKTSGAVSMRRQPGICSITSLKYCVRAA